MIRVFVLQIIVNTKCLAHDKIINILGFAIRLYREYSYFMLAI